MPEKESRIWPTFMAYAAHAEKSGAAGTLHRFRYSSKSATRNRKAEVLSPSDRYARRPSCTNFLNFQGETPMYLAASLVFKTLFSINSSHSSL